ncbi:hypothetical protein AOQ84DRAFT_270125, partial [Glonium stellatum]
NFVALSYVWGSIGGVAMDFRGENSRKKLPNCYSRTIGDAITATKHLGFRYLWVDLYCISRDPAIRHSQIAQMDIIYKSVPIVIIASNEDATYGLPGVSRPQNLQLSCQIEIEHFVSVRLDALNDLEIFKYSTRAWTYQERLFSNCRIAFTGDQAFIE